MAACPGLCQAVVPVAGRRPAEQALQEPVWLPRRLPLLRGHRQRPGLLPAGGADAVQQLRILQRERGVRHVLRAVSAAARRVDRHQGKPQSRRR